jgi:lipid II:glycine glycyltransferase (peptidoglycan interpeptide bridge formation enzyme)
MPEVSATAWTNWLEERPDAHLLQTAEWGDLKAAFGWEPVRIISDEGAGAQILFRRLPLGWSLAYLPKPALGSDWRQLDADFWRQVELSCRRRRAIFLKIEPDAWEEEALVPLPQLIRSPHNIQPPRTIVVDLRGSEDDLLARMKQKTRYNIRLAQKKGVRVRPWDDLEAFYRLMQTTGGRDGFGVHSLEYYRRAYQLFQPGGMGELLVAEYESLPLAALMVFRRGQRAWYFYGASSDEQRNLMPTYLLQWEAMRWARERGCLEYDLWGIPDEDEATLEAGFEKRRDGLWGVYRFKRGFGGTVKRAAQALDWVFQPFWYRLYLRFLQARSML